MECKIHWSGPSTMSFEAETGSGHKILIDSAPESGGQNSGPRPMELILVGAVTCSVFDVVKILSDKCEYLELCDVDVTANRVEKPPRVFREININFTLKGKNLDHRDIEKAIDQTKTVYGSGNNMLKKTANISYSYKITN